MKAPRSNDRVGPKRIFPCLDKNSYGPAFRIILFLLLLIPFSCYEPVEDCLDVYATNFNASADDPCIDCCSYPSFNLSIEHRMGERPLSYDSLYFNGFPDSLRIAEIIFYLSDFRIMGDEPLEVTDLIELEVDEGGNRVSKSFSDDFTLVEFSKGFSYGLGTIRSAGNLDSLSFRLGLDPQVTTVLPDQITEGHNLSLQQDSMWTESDGYLMARIQLVIQSAPDDTLSYPIPALGNSLEIGMNLNQTLPFGENLGLKLQIDYLQWLEGIDFATMGTDNSAVIDKIVSNLPNSVSLVE